MIRDGAFSIFLIVFFGMAGTAVLVLAWAQPMPVSERVLSTFAGSIGLLVALVRMVMLKSVQTRNNAALVPVEVSIEDRS